MLRARSCLKTGPGPASGCGADPGNAGSVPETGIMQPHDDGRKMSPDNPDKKRPSRKKIDASHSMKKSKSVKVKFL